MDNTHLFNDSTLKWSFTLHMEMNARRKKKLLTWIAGCLLLLLSFYCVRQLHSYFVFLKQKSALRHGEFVVDLGPLQVEAFLRTNQPNENAEPQLGYPAGNQSQTSWLGRLLPDTRPPLCRSFHSSNKMLSTSIIMVFKNEPRALLMRTIYSVLLRSPPELIEKIILVDDHSNDASTGEWLSQIPKVKVVRNTESAGLLQSYNTAVSLATSPTLTFLDSQCEVNVGWLPPLLYRLSQVPFAVVTPVIDAINTQTLEYTASDVWRKGGFDWTLNFKWDFVNPGPSQNTIIRSPVYTGHVFSVGRERLITLGKFDPDLGLFGGENLELSIKSWLCGGVVEILPCSRVGQLHLDTVTKGIPVGGDNIYVRNVKRVAEVWMDDYKRFFYYMKPSARMINVGSILERKSLRNKLKCKSFKWYMDNIYPELRPPVTDEVMFGNIRQGDLCIDIQMGHVPAIAKLSPCNHDKSTQDWSLKKRGEITNGGMCLTADAVETHGYVMVHFCTKDPSQVWRYVDGQMYRDGTSQCLDSHKAEVGLVISDCDELYESQKWTFASKGYSSRDKDEV